MQAVVEAPPMRSTEKPVSFRIEGENIPKAVLAFLDALFPDHVRIDDDEDLVAVEDTDWYNRAKSRMTPAKALKIMRTNAGLTQMKLAEKIGMAKQNYNALERGTRPISMMVAKKLADALGTSYTMFYED